MRRIPFLPWLGLAIALSSSVSQGVLFYGTSDPNYNTAAPAGTVAYDAWQYEGHWGSFIGTPIAPDYFITAKHVGGAVGDTFSFGGLSYTTTARFADPNSDLQIWQISGSFPTYAPLYTGSDEAGKSLVVIGRGTQRGDVVTVNGNPQGWHYGAGDSVQRWGQNTVAGIVNLGAGLGYALQANFDQNGGVNEATLSGGDSGGAVFIQEAGAWKLAGINYAVTGPFSLDGGAHTFGAALYDMRGVYLQNGQTWTQVNDPGQAVPSSFYATRISSDQAWISSIVAVPEPSHWAVAIGLGLLSFGFIRAGRRRA